MSIVIGKYEFDGPYTSVADLEEKQGLYVVLHCQGDEYELLHVAEAENIRARIELSQPSYTPVSGSVLLAACYLPQSSARERRKIVEEVLSEFEDEKSFDCDKTLIRQTAF